MHGRVESGRTFPLTISAPRIGVTVARTAAQMRAKDGRPLPHVYGTINCDRHHAKVRSWLDHNQRFYRSRFPAVFGTPRFSGGGGAGLYSMARSVRAGSTGTWRGQFIQPMFVLHRADICARGFIRRTRAWPSQTCGDQTVEKRLLTRREPHFGPLLCARQEGPVRGCPSMQPSNFSATTRRGPYDQNWKARTVLASR